MISKRSWARITPALAGITESLHRSGASIARMTGSGSTIYGIFALPPDAAALARTVPGSLIVTRTATSVQPVTFG